VVRRPAILAYDGCLANRIADGTDVLTAYVAPFDLCDTLFNLAQHGARKTSGRHGLTVMQSGS